jgi:hypothetical protein
MTERDDLEIQDPSGPAASRRPGRSWRTSTAHVMKQSRRGMRKTGGSAFAPHTIVGAVEPDCDWRSALRPPTLVRKGDDPVRACNDLHPRLIVP